MIVKIILGVIAVVYILAQIYALMKVASDADDAEEWRHNNEK